jgi:hypothetical protein
VVASKHFKISETPVREDERLRALQMSVAGHYGVCVLFREVQQSFLSCAQTIAKFTDRFPYPQAQVRRHLIVAAASSVKLTTDVAGNGYKPRLNKRMHILCFKLVKIWLASLPALPDRVQCFNDFLPFSFGNDAGGNERGAVREAGANVYIKQSAIEGKGIIEFGKGRIGLACKSAAP